MSHESPLSTLSVLLLFGLFQFTQITDKAFNTQK